MVNLYPRKLPQQNQILPQNKKDSFTRNLLEPHPKKNSFFRKKKKVKREKILKAITYDKVLCKQPRKKPQPTANSHGKVPQFLAKINQTALILFMFIHISNRNASNQRAFYIIFILKKQI